MAVSPVMARRKLLAILDCKRLKLESLRAEQLLRAGNPDVQPGSGHEGLPEALPGWDSVLLRR